MVTLPCMAAQCRGWTEGQRDRGTEGQRDRGIGETGETRSKTARECILEYGYGYGYETYRPSVGCVNEGAGYFLLQELFHLLRMVAHCRCVEIWFESDGVDVLLLLRSWQQLKERTVREPAEYEACFSVHSS
jgi:hypothetical protein